ncbi:MAG TPA: DUF1080 domain-containing protein [Pirellulales bacterium]|nr:DUF1080 domain-containing protein [Pirellulales bacterium]
MRNKALIGALAALSLAASLRAGESDGFVPLFNGKDFSGWTVPEGDNGHWRVVEGVIDYDAMSEAKNKDKSLWTEKEFGDFTLRLDWRLTATPCEHYKVKIIKPDGDYKLDADGKEINVLLPTADSGVYLRDSTKAQVNIWCWPVGSGEVWGYRTDKDMPAEVRAAVTPSSWPIATSGSGTRSRSRCVATG